MCGGPGIICMGPPIGGLMPPKGDSKGTHSLGDTLKLLVLFNQQSKSQNIFTLLSRMTNENYQILILRSWNQ